MRCRTAVAAAALALVALAAPAAAGTVGHHHPESPYEAAPLALAPDGAVWFVEVSSGGRRVVRLDPATDATTTYTEDLSSVVDLTVGDDGTVWVASGRTGLGDLDPETGEVTWHPYDNGDEELFTLAVATGPDGTIWFSDLDGAGVGSVDPDTGAVDFTVDPDVSLSISPDVVVDGEGAVWYAVPSNFGEGLRRFDPATGTYSSVADPDDLAAQPYALTVDAAGDVWFGDLATGSIGRVDATTATVTTSFTNEAIARVVNQADPSSLAAADDGTIWFAGNGGLGRMETTRGFARSTSRLIEGPTTNWVLEPRFVVNDPSGGIWLTGGDVVAHHLPTCDGRPVTVDHALGQAATDGDDVILGTDGEDTVNGGAGDDVICGGLGDDQLRGGPGRDRIFGGNGADGLKADAGGGLVVGGQGQDAVQGGSGADNLRGGPGNDALDGKAGNDRIDGGTGTNGCHGGPGRDVLLHCVTDALG
jgi:streptogramin lyase